MSRGRDIIKDIVKNHTVPMVMSIVVYVPRLVAARTKIPVIANATTRHIPSNRTVDEVFTLITSLT